MTDNKPWDVVVVGAGPAGLTAALYLARYHRRVLVVHDGKSRALRIPLTHNAPGFPEGINGVDLVRRMTDHATHFGAEIREAHITDIRRQEEGFALSGADAADLVARTVILATGIFLNQVDLPEDVHEQAIKDDVLRYCPICDAYEHTDAHIGVLGCDSNGAAEALFLRRYSDRITLMPLSHPELTASQKAQLDQAGIKVMTGALVEISPRNDRIDVVLEGSQTLGFDVVYPALGCSPRAELGTAFGLAVTESGCLPSQCVTASPIAGLWAAGDVVEGLDQISVAMGHGALAATKAHNWLREQDGETLT